MGYTVKVLVNVMLVFVAFIAAYEFRRALPLEWWFEDSGAQRVLAWAAIYAAIGGLVEIIFRAERAAWRFSSVREALGLLRNTGLTALGFLTLIFLTNRGIDLPRSTLVLAWILSFASLVGIRLLWRLIHNPRLVWSHEKGAPGDAKPLLLVGSLEAADMQIRRLETSNPDRYRPLGVIATDPKAKGLVIKAVPVIADISFLFGAAKLALAGKGGAILFLADPIQEFGLSPDDIGRLKKLPAKLLRLPNVVDLAQGAPEAGKLPEISLEEFLPRRPVQLDPQPIKELVSGRKALVTGAGGSIGSELCRQLVALGCSELTILDHSEFALFEIDRELRASQALTKLVPALGNVRDACRLREVFGEARPDLVFHAAALKHVTLVELNPLEGFLTNVVGTRNVAEASRACGATHMTLVSTDKAVDPSTVMGATKRIAEAVIADQPTGSTQYCTVRFGNVLGSAGSVIPIFREQIESGGPVTVTHPEVERYFMTIPEAVQLILHATALSANARDEGPQRFVLEMGEPVRIVDLARQLIQLYGLAPDVDIPVEFTGLKPGEKLTETLLEEGDVALERMPGVLEIKREAADREIDPRAAGRLAAVLGTLMHQENVVDALAAAGMPLPLRSSRMDSLS